LLCETLNGKTAFMIARITGRLEHVDAAAALVDVGGGLWYEVLVPAFDVERLSRRTGQDVALFTLHYLDGDPAHGGQVPRLVGFLSETDREFFKLFTTVKGIGIRKALRSLVRPVADIAAAIQAKDGNVLASLPEIGPRTAERIVAELHGKLDAFLGPHAAAAEVEIPGAGEEAVSVLVQLGERRVDAVALVQRVLAVAPGLDRAEEIIQQAYKLRAGGL